MQKKLDQVLEIMANLVKGKGAVDGPSSQEGSVPQKVGHNREDPPYPSSFAPPQAQTSQGTYVPIIHPVRGYTYM